MIIRAIRDVGAIRDDAGDRWTSVCVCATNRSSCRWTKSRGGVILDGGGWWWMSGGGGSNGGRGKTCSAPSRTFA